MFTKAQPIDQQAQPDGTTLVTVLYTGDKGEAFKEQKPVAAQDAPGYLRQIKTRMDQLNGVKGVVGQIDFTKEFDFSTISVIDDPAFDAYQAAMLHLGKLQRTFDAGVTNAEADLQAAKDAANKAYQVAFVDRAMF